MANLGTERPNSLSKTCNRQTNRFNRKKTPQKNNTNRSIIANPIVTKFVDCESKLMNPLNCDTICHVIFITSYSMIDEDLAIARQIIAIDPNCSATHVFYQKTTPKPSRIIHPN